MSNVTLERPHRFIFLNFRMYLKNDFSITSTCRNEGSCVKWRFLVLQKSFRSWRLVRFLCPATTQRLTSFGQKVVLSMTDWRKKSKRTWELTWLWWKTFLWMLRQVEFNSFFSFRVFLLSGWKRQLIGHTNRVDWSLAFHALERVSLLTTSFCDFNSLH